MLGTVVDIRVGTGAATRADADCERIVETIVAEFRRLESVFSIYDADSELERWKRDEVDAGPELTAVLALALGWQARSEGAFNLGARSLHELWRRAESLDELPSRATLDDLIASIAEPPYEIAADGAVRRCGDVGGIDLNAIAKGWIVDRAIDAGADMATEVGVDSASLTLIVSAGGDLCHRGPEPVHAGIENPLRPYDNEPPIGHVSIRDEALATSGGARRGFRVAGEWFPHVIDPRTGEPVGAVASVSVVASDTATADVVATIAGLEAPETAVAVADRLATAALVIAPDGERRASSSWRAIGAD